MGHLITSESVTSGHPDKLCDFISDSILDKCLSLDPNSRVAIEVFVKGLDSIDNNRAQCFIIIGGEITMNENFAIDFEKIARKCAEQIGYTDMDVGMDATNIKRCEVQVLISQQSEEISKGVLNLKNGVNEQGAGDQGIIYGYASDESERYELTKGAYMPLPILLAHKLTLEITKKRLSGDLEWARPDGKSQVTIQYDDAGNPKYIDTIVIAIQHDDLIGGVFKTEKEEQEYIANEIENKIIRQVIPLELITEDMNIIINGTGRFCKGGPHADAGLTGRKIIVDTYGGIGRHGGGAFSGKDPTKVDRSAAYAARWAAKHIVASNLAKSCEIQLAYSIGRSKPVSINVELGRFENGEYNDEYIRSLIIKNFDFRPASIIDNLNLRTPIYSITSSGGHFGRTNYEKGEFPWETLSQEIINNLKE
jgi:S-adenosylmethionine synthetase